MSYSFNPVGHKHLWNGKRMTGVTTILGIISKPALIGWAANMAVDYIENDIVGIHEDTENYVCPFGAFKKLLKEARTAHTKKRDAAGDIGKTVHSAIEQFIKQGTEPTLDEQGMKMFENFRKWSVDNKVKFIENEKHLYSEKMFVGGICDAVVEIDGKKWLYDWKTGGTRVYAEAFWQCAAYTILLDEMGEHKDIVGYGVLGVFKDGTMEDKRSVSTDEHKLAFMSAYNIYKIKQKTDNQIL